MIICLVDHPEEGTDSSSETLDSCQRMTPDNDPEAFIQDNDHSKRLQSHISSLYYMRYAFSAYISLYHL
jgi:hypothetical protein